MERETLGHAAGIQAASETGQQVKMIFPMAGGSITADTVLLDPPQAVASPPMPESPGISEGESTSTTGDGCPAVESTTQVNSTTNQDGSKGQNSKLESTSPMDASETYYMVENASTLPSSDSAEADSISMPLQAVPAGSQEKDVEKDKDRCRTHPDETVTTYCQSCNRLVCLECLVEDDTHGSHKKITIKKLLATPEFFSETSEGLSKLLAHKEQYLENLQQAAADIELGHESQIKAIRDMEQRALEELDRGLEAETEKLIAAGEKQEEQIKEVARSAVEGVEKHMEVQTSTILAERKKVEASLPTLSDLTATMEKEPSTECLHDLVKGYQRSEHILKNQTKDFLITGVETKAEKVNGKAMEKFTKLAVKVVDTAAHATDGAQTEKLAFTTVTSVEDLRTRVKAIVSNTVVDHSQEKRKGSAVLYKDYFTICSNFALHSSILLPGCYQEPDFTEPVDMHNDLIFIDPSDAQSLSSLLGGKPNLTVHQINSHWFLKNHEGSVVSYLVWMHDSKGQYVVVTTAEDTRRSASVFLPGSSNLYCALESYLGWRPSDVQYKQSKRTISPLLTVNEWGHSTSSCRLIVIE